ncbi:MAG: vitamin K epoxide reductase family protein [Cellulomonas sp.]|nr:vitamin K epoxide reductase family protein [Cellulomonas sp.]
MTQRPTTGDEPGRSIGVDEPGGRALGAGPDGGGPQGGSGPGGEGFDGSADDGSDGRGDDGFGDEGPDDGPDADPDPDLLQPSTAAWRSRTAIEMLISGLIGLYASFVLSIDAWILAGNPDATFSCNVSQVINCGTVARTWQAQLLGFPNAFLGILFESVVLTLSVATIGGVRFPRWFMRGAQALYTVGLLFALWLFTQSYFVIHALCPWCLLITLTTTLVWAGLTRINVRDGHLPLGAGARRFVAGGSDWYVTVAFLIVLLAMILVRYGPRLLA